MSAALSVLFADNAYGTISTSLAVGDTALNFTTGHGARFPVVAAGQVLYCTMVDSTNVVEEIQITAHTANADVATIVRGQGNTAAKAWSAGARIEARVSSTSLIAAFQEPLTDLNPLIKNNTDPTKLFQFNVSNVPTGSTATQTTGAGGILPAGIGPLPYAGSSVPAGWLLCNGTAVSRTTYAALFTAISTVWGTGDGSTTFNLPDMRGRGVVGAGTGITTETVSGAATVNAVPVQSNNTKWITGMQTVVSSVGGYTGGFTTGTYWVIRNSSTAVQLANSLANAQNLTPVTITGTGTATLTTTWTARSLGETGGEEAHAQNMNELLAHNHSANTDNANVGGNPVYRTGNANNSTVPNLSTGGNAAMNIETPFAVVNYIISY
jgi:microcystin-dependent protein